MEKTLIVGNLHLQGSKILPEVEKICQKEAITKIILMGDYFDQWHQTYNDELIIFESEFLKDWVKKNKDFEVICLLGNHDIPYITGNLRYYSNQNPKVIASIKDTLFKIKAQVCTEVVGYIISHAGFVGKHYPETWQLQPIENIPTIISKLNEIEQHVGICRGGYHRNGSVVWADLDELIANYNQKYPKQIVGHSPVSTVSNFNDLWVVDTLSLTTNLLPIGDGSMLILESGMAKVIQSNIMDIIKNDVDKW